MWRRGTSPEVEPQASAGVRALAPMDTGAMPFVKCRTTADNSCSDPHHGLLAEETESAYHTVHPANDLFAPEQTEKKPGVLEETRNASAPAQ